MTKDDRSFLEEFRRGINAQLSASADIQDMMYKDIKDVKESVTLQNGRVRTLEMTATRRGVYWKIAIPAAVVMFIAMYIIAETAGLGVLLMRFF